MLHNSFILIQLLCEGQAGKVLETSREEKLFQIWESIIYWLTYSMEQSTFKESNRLSASQGISNILWNLNVHYRI